MFMKRHVLSMREFSREEIDSVLDLAASLEPYARGKKSDMMAGKILPLLFFEPSTRTRMSFETAMKRLGGGVINLGPAEGSSISKGESLADTVRVVAGYSEALSGALLSSLLLRIKAVARELLPAPTSCAILPKRLVYNSNS
jgi:aspartate carbamoyltransferase catalytic subunit